MQNKKLNSELICSLNFKEVSRIENSLQKEILYSNEYFNPDFSSEFSGIIVNAIISNTFGSSGEDRWMLKVPSAFSNPRLRGFDSSIDINSVEELEIQISKIKEAVGLN